MAEEQDTPPSVELQDERSKHAAYMRKYRAANKEKYKEIDKEHGRRQREKNPVGFLERAKARTAKYYDKKRATMTPEEREKLNAANRLRNAKYREKHADRIRKRKAETARLRYAKDPQKALSVCHRRRAKIKQGWVSKRDWVALCEKHEHKCFYCDKVFERKELTQDHFQPLTKGGKHEIDNIVPACMPCNQKKSNKW